MRILEFLGFVSFFSLTIDAGNTFKVISDSKQDLKRSCFEDKEKLKKEVDAIVPEAQNRFQRSNPPYYWYTDNERRLLERKANSLAMSVTQNFRYRSARSSREVYLDSCGYEITDELQLQINFFRQLSIVDNENEIEELLKNTVIQYRILLKMRQNKENKRN